MSSAGLTPTQERALRFIVDFQAAYQSSPSLREICDHMGYSAIGSAQDLVKALKRKGYLITNPSRSRSITLSEAAKPFRPEKELMIPLLGYVPAGSPISVFENKIGEIHMTAPLLHAHRGSSLYALLAMGDSMIGAGILDGDQLIIVQQNDAVHREIVIADVGGEVTCKRLGMDARKGWYLQPENPRYSIIWGSESHFSILGRVIGVQRWSL